MSTIAIVGRPNVGKSLLFNRLVGKRKSVVEDVEGVTRDAIFSTRELEGRTLTFVDTGGMDYGYKIPFSSNLIDMARSVLDKANLILMVVDGKSGITKEDILVAKELFVTKKKIAVVVNKVDNLGSDYDFSEFYGLGFDLVFPVSALHDKGIDPLIDFVMEEKIVEAKPKKDLTRIVLLGAPNVGKSTLVNKLLGEHVMLVSDTKGTTVDSVESFGDHFIFVDTAGVKRKSSEISNVEKHSTVSRTRNIQRGDICLLLLDPFLGLTSLNKDILVKLHRISKGCLVFVNKSDLLEDVDKNKYMKFLRDKLRNIPIILGSAKFGTLKELTRLLKTVEQNFGKRISTSKMNSLLKDSLEKNPPYSKSGEKIVIYYITQVSVKPPKFVIFVNKTGLITDNWKKYLTNRITREFDFSGIPISIKIKGKKDRH